MWIRILRNGTKYHIDGNVISLLSIGDYKDYDAANLIIKVFENARLFGAPEDLHSVWIHGKVSYRNAYGHVMYIRRHRSVSLHVSSGRIRREFGKCAAYWGWQVLVHEIAHLIGVDGGHYLKHGNVHLNVSKELILETLPINIAIPTIYYLFLDYSLSNCKRGYSRVDMDFINNGLRKVINDYAIDERQYLNCANKLREVIDICSRKSQQKE